MFHSVWKPLLFIPPSLTAPQLERISSYHNILVVTLYWCWAEDTRYISPGNGLTYLYPGRMDGLWIEEILGYRVFIPFLDLYRTYLPDPFIE